MQSSVNKTCAVCSSLLNNKNRSKEHIIPNSIGGRRKTTNFICNTCNNRLGHTWDAELARQLNWCSLMVGISRENGEVPRQIIQTVDGSRLWLKNDGTMTPEKPAYREESTGGKTTISISARDMTEASRMLKNTKRHHPTFDVEKAYQELEVQQIYLDSPIHVDMGIGGPEAGRSIVKTAFAHASDSGVPHQFCSQALRYLSGQSCSPPFGFAYLSDCVENRSNDTVFHCVSLSGDPETGRLISYVEYFGLFRFFISLSDDYSGKRIQETYAIDPTTGSVLSISVDWSVCERELGAILAGDGYSEEGHRAAADYALPIILKRSSDRHTSRATHEAFFHAAQALGINEGELIPPEKHQEFVGLMLENLTPFIRHMVTRNRPSDGHPVLDWKSAHGMPGSST